ncbi:MULTISPECIES: sensor histidine kinase [Actinomyces]|uniref:sensor histidine kinase n=1 Tax=Actinomyces TaxID=1654 RepID=UPI0013580EB7|nr:MULTISPECIES: HAMP domain-containing sensor histidine kinase [Actinomyces]
MPPSRRRGRFHPIIESKRYWHSQPLRTRLALITTGLLTVGLLATSLVTTQLLQTHLIGQVDNQLKVTSRTIGDRGLEYLQQDGRSSQAPTTYYLEAQYSSGKIGRMVNDKTTAEYGIPSLGTLSLDNREPFTVPSSLPGHYWRVLPLEIKDQDGDYAGIVAIALPLRNVRDTVEQTRVVVAVTDVVVVLVGAALATYLVHRSFGPLRQIEGVAGRISRGDLSARVPVTEPPMTEVGSLQQALNTMLQQNEHAFSVQVTAQVRMTRFVSDASHELRTPLSAIQGYGELYRMGGVPAERTSEVMGRIESEATRMGRLVEDLLQLARMDEGRKMDTAPVDLTAVCAGALTDMVVLAPERDCALLRLDGGPEAPQPLTVMGDRDRLAQVVTNLLGNVVRHTPAGTPVEIALGPIGGRSAIIEVRDHGPGIAPADASKVFQRFYRADTSRNRETGGSGLGLSIVAAIVQRHHGTIGITPTPGGGATVRIELPLAQPEQAPVPAGDGPRAGRRG